MIKLGMDLSFPKAKNTSHTPHYKPPFPLGTAFTAVIIWPACQHICDGIDRPTMQYPCIYSPKIHRGTPPLPSRA